MSKSITDCLSAGTATSKELQFATGLNQTAVSRELRAMGDKIIKLKSGRSTIYAMTRNAFGADDKLSLSMIDAHGNPKDVAAVRPLMHGGYFIEELAGMPSVLLGESKDGIYDDLPYFLSDLAPQGFIGRQIAKSMASESSDFPDDPRMWNSEHIGRYLVSNGEDLAGNFKFGPVAHQRRRKRIETATPEQYPRLADEVIDGFVAGTSAGGEQPKFTTFCKGARGHVIVKFSPKGNDAIARRWRDILITEHYATKAIISKGLPAAETRLIEKKGRLFLESKRFDRLEESGRKSMISLLSIDNEFTAKHEWNKTMEGLRKRQLVSSQDCVNTASLYAFGKLIQNSDMHLGNISLSIEGDVFRLLPIYDMCSMGFSPKATEVLPFKFTPYDISQIKILDSERILMIKDMAADFWTKLSKNKLISKEFKKFISTL